MLNYIILYRIKIKYMIQLLVLQLLYLYLQFTETFIKVRHYIGLSV